MFVFFLSLFTVIFVARAFPCFHVVRACLYDANFLLTVTVLFSLSILTIVQ